MPAKSRVTEKSRVTDKSIEYDALLVVGDNGNGQLGFEDEDITEKKRTVRAELGTGEGVVTAIGSGSMHSAVVVHRNRTEELLTAGCGDDGQLGRTIPPESDAERSFQAATVRGLANGERFTALACSDNATFALTTNGRLFVTGSFRDRNGRFRITRSEERRREFSPLVLDTARSGTAAKQTMQIAQVAAGGNFALLLTSNGDVLSFGVGECGELGRLPASERLRSRVSADDYFEPSPILVPPGTKFDRVFAGEFTAFARVDLTKTAARVRSTLLAIKLQSSGANKRTREEAEEETSESRPAKAARLDGDSAAVSAPASTHTARSKRVSNARASTEVTGSILFVFGLNNRGQLGLADPLSEVRKPTAIHLPFRVEKIAAGQHHTLLLDSDGFVYAIGRPEYGRLGLGEISDDVIGAPRRITALPYKESGGCVDIAATIENSFAVMRDGTAYSFGAPNSILGLGYSNDDDHEPEVVPVLMRSKALNEYEAHLVSAGSQHALFAARLKPGGNPNVTMNVSTMSMVSTTG